MVLKSVYFTVSVPPFGQFYISWSLGYTMGHSKCVWYTKISYVWILKLSIYLGYWDTYLLWQSTWDNVALKNVTCTVLVPPFELTHIYFLPKLRSGY